MFVTLTNLLIDPANVRLLIGLVLGFLLARIWEWYRAYPRLSFYAQLQGDNLNLLVTNHSANKLKPYVVCLFQYPVHDGVGNFNAVPHWLIADRDDESQVDKFVIPLGTSDQFEKITKLLANAMERPVLRLAYAHNKFNPMADHVFQAKVLFESEALGVVVRDMILNPSMQERVQMLHRLTFSVSRVERERAFGFLKRRRLQKKADQFHRAHEQSVIKKNTRSFQKWRARQAKQGDGQNH
jgi:hypothetical protein